MPPTSWPASTARRSSDCRATSRSPSSRASRRSPSSTSGRIDPDRIEEYIAVGGYSALVDTLTMVMPAGVVQQVVRSGLRGRGGGGYPTGLKWSTVAKARAPKKYVICNGDEGDPGAFMDRSVLESDPHRIIEGMALAAYAVGATDGYMYVRAEYPLAVKRLRTAIKQAEKLGLLGNEICGTTFNFRIDIRLGAGAFVCGEETALIASIEGNRGTPRPRPPYPAEVGLWGAPTLINNVETYAAIPAIIRNGGHWYAAIGTAKSKGTKVFALAGRVNNTGLIEVPMGLSLREIIFDIGGGIPEGRRFKAVQTGGPSGGCLPEAFLDMPVDYESLGKAGSIMGSGGMIVMDDTSCMVDVARYFMDFCMTESCGKCIPCRVGTVQLHAPAPQDDEGRGDDGRPRAARGVVRRGAAHQPVRALAETEGAALAAALHLAHEVDPDADQQQHRTPADEDAHQQRGLFARLDVEFDAVVDEIADQAPVEVGGRTAQALVVVRERDDLGTAASAFLERDGLDALAAHLFQEIGIADLVALGHAAVELLEDGEQHERDHQPDSDFGKPLIIHRGSFSSSAARHGTCAVPDSTAYGDDSIAVKMGFMIGNAAEKACNRGVCARVPSPPGASPRFGTQSDEKGFGRLVTRGLGLDGFDDAKTVLEEFGLLAITAAVKGLAYQRAFRLQVAQRELHRQFDQVRHTGGVRRLDARQVGGHVRHHHVHRPPAEPGFQRVQHLVFAEVALHEDHALDGLDLDQVQRDDAAVEFTRRPRPAGRTGAAGTGSRPPAPRPGPPRPARA